mmetsp:Transcript_17449/g.41845  ORF Transcript_17449/g.41845 Transcript_17449/m.41845 type:complete len:96 (+) Transcript_17449:489-776(+)
MRMNPMNYQHICVRVPSTSARWCDENERKPVSRLIECPMLENYLLLLLQVISKAAPRMPFARERLVPVISKGSYENNLVRKGYQTRHRKAASIGF